MNVDLYNQNAEVIGTTQLSDAVFNVPMNADILHQAITAQEANARHAIAHTKGRGEVRGGGRKPWRQKGTGRARHASIRSPIWKGGGVAFGPTKERNFSQKINKKIARKALVIALSSKVRDGEFMLLDALRLSVPKTKEAVGILKNFKLRGSLLFVTPAKDRTLERATRNIPRTSVSSAPNLNVRDIVASKHVIFLKDAIPFIHGNI